MKEGTPMGQVAKGQMEEVHKEAIERIILQMECPKDFRCYTSGFEVLCVGKGYWNRHMSGVLGKGSPRLQVLIVCWRFMSFWRFISLRVSSSYLYL